MLVWHHCYHTPSILLPRKTFLRGGYNDVPDGYVDGWPHAKYWPHLAKKKGNGRGGAWVQGVDHHQWIDENFQLHTMMLEFREMLGRHGGKEMAHVVEETVAQWGLEERCLGFTIDNASSNIAAFKRMSEEGSGQCFFNSRMHFR
ncbi:unnamed protein product [Closterium sp. NIES-54]